MLRVFGVVVSVFLLFVSFSLCFCDDWAWCSSFCFPLLVFPFPRFYFVRVIRLKLTLFFCLTDARHSLRPFSREGAGSVRGEDGRRAPRPASSLSSFGRHDFGSPASLHGTHPYPYAYPHAQHRARAASPAASSVGAGAHDAGAGGGGAGKGSRWFFGGSPHRAARETLGSGASPSSRASPSSQASPTSPMSLQHKRRPLQHTRARRGSCHAARAGRARVRGDRVRNTLLVVVLWEVLWLLETKSLH